MQLHLVNRLLNKEKLLSDRLYLQRGQCSQLQSIDCGNSGLGHGLNNQKNYFSQTKRQLQQTKEHIQSLQKMRAKQAKDENGSSRINVQGSLIKSNGKLANKNLQQQQLQHASVINQQQGDPSKNKYPEHFKTQSNQKNLNQVNVEIIDASQLQLQMKQKQMPRSQNNFHGQNGNFKTKNFFQSESNPTQGQCQQPYLQQKDIKLSLSSLEARAKEIKSKNSAILSLMEKSLASNHFNQNQNHNRSTTAAQSNSNFSGGASTDRGAHSNSDNYNIYNINNSNNINQDIQSCRPFTTTASSSSNNNALMRGNIQTSKLFLSLAKPKHFKYDQSLLALTCRDKFIQSSSKFDSPRNINFQADRNVQTSESASRLSKDKEINGNLQIQFQKLKSEFDQHTKHSLKDLNLNRHITVSQKAALESSSLSHQEAKKSVKKETLERAQHRRQVSRTSTTFTSTALNCIPSINNIKFVSRIDLNDSSVKQRLGILNRSLFQDYEDEQTKTHDHPHKTKKFIKRTISSYVRQNGKNINQAQEEYQVMTKVALNLYRKIKRKYVQGIQKGGPIEDDNEAVRKLMLVVYNSNLEIVRSKSTLQYCYIEVPIPDEMKRQSLVLREYEEIKSILKNKFSIAQSRDVYVFLPDGTQLNSLIEIPLVAFTIVVSVSPFFSGLASFPTYLQLQNIIIKLEIPTHQNKKLIDANFSTQCMQTVEQRLKHDFAGVIDQAVETVQQNNQHKNSQHKNNQHENMPLTTEEGTALEIQETKLSELGLGLGEFMQQNINDQQTSQSAQKEVSLLLETNDDQINNNNAHCINNALNQDQDTNLKLDNDIYQLYLKNNINNLLSQQKDSKCLPGDQTKQSITLITISKRLDQLLKQWNAMQLKKSVKMRKYLKTKFLFQDPLIETQEQKLEEINVQKKNLGGAHNMNQNKVIQNNINAVRTGQAKIKLLRERNAEIYQQNIPKLMMQSNFKRRELHQVYILFKVLQDVTSQRYDLSHKEYGVDYETYKNGIYQVFMQGEALARKIFSQVDQNMSGFIHWDSFLKLMVAIRAKTQKEKIDLFVKIADEDGNGKLSKEEIFSLCKVCLIKYVNDEGTFLTDLCQYFTKLIFSAVQYQMDQEIPLSVIKNAILSGNEESDLLTMFCGADL